MLNEVIFGFFVCGQLPYEVIGLTTLALNEVKLVAVPSKLRNKLHVVFYEVIMVEQAFIMFDPFQAEPVHIQLY